MNAIFNTIATRHFPGLGDSETWSPCAGHDNDPRSDNEAYIDRLDDLLNGEYNPFAAENLIEAMGDMSPALSKVAADALAAEDFILYGQICHGHTISYWTKQAEEHIRRKA